MTMQTSSASTMTTAMLTAEKIRCNGVNMVPGIWSAGGRKSLWVKKFVNNWKNVIISTLFSVFWKEMGKITITQHTCFFNLCWQLGVYDFLKNEANGIRAQADPVENQICAASAFFSCSCSLSAMRAINSLFVGFPLVLLTV